MSIERIQSERAYLPVSLNGHFLALPATGSGQYTLQLIQALRTVAPDVLPLVSADRPPAPGVDVTVQLCPPRLRRLSFNLAKVWWEQVGWPRCARQQAARLLHVPYFAPPLVAHAPVIATIHDLIQLVYPAYAGSLAVRLYNRLVALGARRCAALLADSEASRRDILRLLHVPPERVRVVYLAASSRFRPCEDRQALAAIRTKYGLPERYILYLGGLDVRKNVPALLRAYARLPQTLRREQRLCLAIVGRPRSDAPLRFPPLEPEIARLGIENEVRLLGWVPEDDKPLLYAAAALFAFPSLYEGFGLDPLEALACGTPVVCSNRTSLPEVVGNAGLLVDPADEHAFAAAIEQVLTSPALAAELAARGPRRAACFSWEHTAREVAETYRYVFAGS